MKLISLILLFCFPTFAEYQNPNLDGFLLEFQTNPYKVMNQTPYKSKKLPGFELNTKLVARKKLLSGQPKEEISGINALSTLFRENQNILVNSFEIDDRPLKTAKLMEIPWAGYYWSMANGLLGFRYADKGFVWNDNWENRLEYVTQNPMSSFLENKIEKLSPSEKYDLLIGNYNTPITTHMWEEGKKEIGQYQKIRDWSGLCHGLAMASLKFPWPKYSVKVKSADNKYLIKFYPEDIKALGIYHWSGDNIPLRKLGGRCEETSPRVERTGRVKNPNCRDPNPGSFHIALINRIGIQKKSIIMDSASDAEVWNYPIISYNFTYFNLNSGGKNNKIKNAMIPINDFKKDFFSEFRSSLTENIVGVDAKIGYLVHKDPAQNDKDPSTDVSIVYASYRYDLELDGKGNIIGGEWYSNKNPDFIWFPEDDADPKAAYDYLIKNPWDPAKDSLPPDWIESANSSAERGQVSSNIVKTLFQYSNKGQN